MAASEVVSGVGIRHGWAIPLASDGLPAGPVSATMIPGTLLQGIKTLTINDPDAQKITHYGDDFPFAKDQLPPTETGDFSMTLAKSNLIVSALLSGTKVVTIGENVMMAANTNKEGSEPRMGAFFYRQALDTKNNNANFGKLRQWNWRMYQSVQFEDKDESYAQTNTDKTINATPTPTATTLWGQPFTDTVWGCTLAQSIPGNSNYQPVPNFARGNGTITAFQLTHAPVSSAELDVWVNGTLVTPSAVNTSTTNPAFTLSVAPGVDQLVFALSKTNQVVS